MTDNKIAKTKTLGEDDYYNALLEKSKILGEDDYNAFLMEQNIQRDPNDFGLFDVPEDETCVFYNLHQEYLRDRLGDELYEAAKKMTMKKETNEPKVKKTVYHRFPGPDYDMMDDEAIEDMAKSGYMSARAYGWKYRGMDSD